MRQIFSSISQGYLKNKYEDTIAKNFEALTPQKMLITFNTQMFVGMASRFLKPSE